MAFKKGQSGNPAGRPKNEKTNLTKIREALIAEAPEVLRTLIHQAKAGEPQALKLFMERVLPALKTQTLPVIIRAEGTLAQQGEAVLQAALTGALSLDIAERLINALTAQTKLTELDLHARKVVEDEAFDRRLGFKWGSMGEPLNLDFLDKIDGTPITKAERERNERKIMELLAENKRAPAWLRKRAREYTKRFETWHFA